MPDWSMTSTARRASERDPDRAASTILMDTPLVGIATNEPQSPAGGGQQGARRRPRSSGSSTIGDLDLDHPVPDGPGHPDRSVWQGFGMANRIANQLGDHDLGLTHDGRVHLEIMQRGDQRTAGGPPGALLPWHPKGLR